MKGECATCSVKKVIHWGFDDLNTGYQNMTKAGKMIVRKHKVSVDVFLFQQSGRGRVSGRILLVCFSYQSRTRLSTSQSCCTGSYVSLANGELSHSSSHMICYLQCASFSWVKKGSFQRRGAHDDKIRPSDHLSWGLLENHYSLFNHFKFILVRKSFLQMLKIRVNNDGIILKIIRNLKLLANK